MPKIVFDGNNNIVVIADFDELCIAIGQVIEEDHMDLTEDDAARLEALAKQLRMKFFDKDKMGN